MNQANSDTLSFKIWPLVGPTAAFVILFAMLVKASSLSIALPFIACIGVLFAWIWQLDGLKISLPLLAITFAYTYSSISQSDKIWFWGLVLAVALTQWITALASEEWEEELQTLIPSLPEKDSLFTEAPLKSASFLINPNPVAVAPTPIAAAPIDENKEVKADHAELLINLETAQNSYLQAQQGIQQLQTERTTLLHNHQLELNRLQQQQQEALATVEKMRTSALTELSITKEALSLSQTSLQKLEQEKQLQQSKVLASENHVEDIKKELTAADLKLKELKEENAAITLRFAEPERALRIAEGKYRQLQEQFAAKTDLLDQTRQTLFQMEEKLQFLQIKREEELYKRPEEVLHLEQHLIRLEEEFDRTTLNYQNEIDALHEIVEKLLTTAQENAHVTTAKVPRKSRKQ